MRISGGEDQMLRIRVKSTASEGLMILTFYLLLFQNALEQFVSVFSYTDEIFALFGMTVILYQSLLRGKLVIKKTTGKIMICFSLFLVAGILGNILYRYQPIQAVLIYLYTNMKFYLSIISGYVFFSVFNSEKDHNLLAMHARCSAVILFMLLLADQIFGLFPNPEYRYGLPVARLFYFHPTYLAASQIFLLSILTAFYRKKNNLPIAMCLYVLAFTLRGKAIAGAAVYCFLVYFLIYYRKKLRFWHFVLIGLVAFAVAGEQLLYYYFELEGRSARSALTQTSIKILADYFPIGTGFGTFASASAAEYYTPVYAKYHIDDVWGLSKSFSAFSSDTFWPIIIGQTGAIGTACYIVAQILLFRQILKIREISRFAYTTGIFIFAYLLISSTSEPAFNNAIAMPLAVTLGGIYTLEKQHGA